MWWDLVVTFTGRGCGDAGRLGSGGERGGGSDSSSGSSRMRQRWRCKQARGEECPSIVGWVGRHE